VLQVWQVLRQSNIPIKSNGYAAATDLDQGVAQVLPVLQPTRRDAP
jgi:hypothetical protein